MSGCVFCQRKVSIIDYKDVASLGSGIKLDGTIRANRGKLNRKGKHHGGSGLCRKHQSQLARAVKRARFMALLPQGPPPKIVEWPPKERKKR